MNTRYKITKLDGNGNPELTLTDMHAFFETQSDFVYRDVFSPSKDGVQMTINGDFFMWQLNELEIPFRFFDGELYVAVSHPIILQKVEQIAAQLQAVFVEG